MIGSYGNSWNVRCYNVCCLVLVCWKYAHENTTNQQLCIWNKFKLPCAYSWWWFSTQYLIHVGLFVGSIFFHVCVCVWVCLCISWCCLILVFVTRSFYPIRMGEMRVEWEGKMVWLFCKLYVRHSLVFIFSIVNVLCCVCPFIYTTFHCVVCVRVFLWRWYIDLHFRVYLVFCVEAIPYRWWELMRCYHISVHFRLYIIPYVCSLMSVLLCVWIRVRCLTAIQLIIICVCYACVIRKCPPLTVPNTETSHSNETHRIDSARWWLPHSIRPSKRSLPAGLRMFVPASSLSWHVLCPQRLHRLCHRRRRHRRRPRRPFLPAVQGRRVPRPPVALAVAAAYTVAVACTSAVAASLQAWISLFVRCGWFVTKCVRLVKSNGVHKSGLVSIGTVLFAYAQTTINKGPTALHQHKYVWSWGGINIQTSNYT